MESCLIRLACLGSSFLIALLWLWLTFGPRNESPEVTRLRLIAARPVIVQGTIFEQKDPWARRGRGAPPRKYVYSFSANGRAYQGEAYMGGLAVGSPVTVSYCASNPAIHCQGNVVDLLADRKYGHLGWTIFVSVLVLGFAGMLLMVAFSPS